MKPNAILAIIPTENTAELIQMPNLCTFRFSSSCSTRRFTINVTKQPQHEKQLPPKNTDNINIQFILSSRVIVEGAIFLGGGGEERLGGDTGKKADGDEGGKRGGDMGGQDGGIGGGVKNGGKGGLNGGGGDGEGGGGGLGCGEGVEYGGTGEGGGGGENMILG